MPQLALAIDRQLGDASARTIRTQVLTPAIVERLRGDGLRFRDTGLPDPADGTRRITYRASLVRSGSDTSSTPVARSTLVRLRWPPAPPLPEQPTLEATSRASVQLRWPSRGYATRVLRRDVLNASDTPRPIATVAAEEGATSVYQDEDVDPGDVLAYQIAYGTPLEVEIGSKDRTHPSHRRPVRWGPVSEALYVSVK